MVHAGLGGDYEQYLRLYTCTNHGHIYNNYASVLFDTRQDKSTIAIASIPESPVKCIMCSHLLFQFYGETCRVVNLSPGGLTTIAAKQKLCCFPPPFLEPYDDLSSLPWSNPLPHSDNLEALKTYLKKNSDQVCMQLKSSAYQRYMYYILVLVSLGQILLPKGESGQQDQYLYMSIDRLMILYACVANSTIASEA